MTKCEQLRPCKIHNTEVEYTTTKAYKPSYEELEESMSSMYCNEEN